MNVHADDLPSSSLKSFEISLLMLWTCTLPRWLTPVASSKTDPLFSQPSALHSWPSLSIALVIQLQPSFNPTRRFSVDPISSVTFPELPSWSFMITQFHHFHTYTLNFPALTFLILTWEHHDLINFAPLIPWLHFRSEPTKKMRTAISHRTHPLNSPLRTTNWPLMIHGNHGNFPISFTSLFSSTLSSNLKHQFFYCYSWFSTHWENQASE